MSEDTPPETATQLDRLIAVVLAVGYLVGLAWFLDHEATDRVIAYYVGAGTLVILPTIVYLLTRVWAFRGISDKLDALHSTTVAIEKQTNGALTARLESQTEMIVSRILEELEGNETVGSLAPERAYPNEAAQYSQA